MADRDEAAPRCNVKTPVIYPGFALNNGCLPATGGDVSLVILVVEESR